MNLRTILILAFLLVFWGIPSALGILTDWFWFVDLGFQGVFRIRLLAQGGLFLLGAAAALGLVMGSAALADRLSRRAVGLVEFPGSAHVRAMEPSFRLAVAGGSLVIALMAAGSLAGGWSEVLRFLRPTPFEA
ncbi:MAG: UPF0182 family protein, partial [Armatimonadetes bacterium]|nr:UPF0182 family protein [Armatimonadota bacterium]